MTKEDLLKKFYGHSSFRMGQDELIDKIICGNDVLGVMPTGAGKSVCYQIPSLMSEGLTIVVSPLISLMEDQVTALHQMGINAAYLNSTLSSEDYMRTVFDAQNGCYKILYVAPERLLTDSFLRIAESVRIFMVTVDEAHCVSQWGQDFRPSYMDIPKFIERLPYRPIISAFTATATPEVKKDICKMLRLENPFVLTTSFDRENLYFAVKAPRDKYQALKEIVDKHSDKFGIVYCSTRKYVEEVCRKLNEDGYSATRYHAGLDDRERKNNQDDFVFDRKQVMVATNAFGMGIDKSNVAYVVHYNMPKNLESYYQEAGRAGRDGGYAECTVLYAKMDVRTNRFLIDKSQENSNLDEETREILYEKDCERLKQMTFYCTISSCLRSFILRYFGEKTSKDCGNCSNCLGDYENFDITVDAQKIISCIYRASEKCTKTEIIDILKGVNSDYTTLSTYGIMKDADKRDISEIIDYLIEIKYLREYDSVLVLEKSADSFIKERRSLYRRVQIKAPQIVAAPPKVELVPVDERLLRKLKELRGSLAKIQSVPAYVVFTDVTLRDMCTKLPQTKEDFLGVSGVGAAKCEHYGEKFLYEIKKYVKENKAISF